MQRNKLYRGLLAIATVATFWSAPVNLQAKELQRLVVIGIPLDKVALTHPTPEYPRSAVAFGLDGKVRIEVILAHGRIVETSTLSGNPMLAYSAKQWILKNWRFKPEVNGVFTIPIEYKRQA